MNKNVENMNSMPGKNSPYKGIFIYGE